MDLGFGGCLSVDGEWTERFSSSSACTCSICTSTIVRDIVRMCRCPQVFEVIRERLLDDEGIQYSHRASALDVESERVLLIFFVP